MKHSMLVSRGHLHESPRNSANRGMNAIMRTRMNRELYKGFFCFGADCNALSQLRKLMSFSTIKSMPSDTPRFSHERLVSTRFPKQHIKRPKNSEAYSLLELKLCCGTISGEEQSSAAIPIPNLKIYMSPFYISSIST